MNSLLKKSCLQRSKTLQIKDLKALSPGVGLGKASLVAKSPQGERSSLKNSLRLPEVLEEPLMRQGSNLEVRDLSSKVKSGHQAEHKKLRFFYILSLLSTDTFFIAFLGFLAWACVLLLGALTGFEHSVIKEKVTFLWEESSWVSVSFFGGALYFFYYFIFYTTVGSPLSKLLLRRR